MRLLKIVLPVLMVLALAPPAALAAPGGVRAVAPPVGWAITDTGLVWRAPGHVPVGGAAVEFWEGDRLLGRPRPSADHRTFTLDAVRFTDPAQLSVRVGARRLDRPEPPRPASAAPAAVPAPLPAASVDPGVPGPFATTAGEYVLDPIALPGYPAAVEMRAVVVGPVDAPGRRPLALFLHGRHETCYDPALPFPGSMALEWPCPAGADPVPSYRGYLPSQRLLASQGYMTVSISANGINGQDATIADLGAQGRSSLVRQHLARWADWAGRGRNTAPDIVRGLPTANLSEVLLVGHSRGGEGVNQAALDTLSPPPEGSGYDGPVRWTVRGTVLIGPTIFGLNPAPDVPSVTILPGCDGDVSDLQGEMYLDATRGVSRGTAVHSALYVVGANHNYFNTEWTPGQSSTPAYDDVWFPDHPVCGRERPARLSATEQQDVGAAYVAAAARLFVAGDRRVLPLVDGTGVRMPSAGPARVLSHAVGGARTPFVVPDATTSVSGDARRCAQVTQDAATACLDPLTSASHPHFASIRGVSSDPDRFAVALSGAGTVRPAEPVSLARSRSLALRLIVPPNTTDTRFDVSITDSRGRTARLGSVSVDGLPAGEFISALWAQEVRLPLPRHGVDLGRVAALDIVGTGPAWLIDAHGWRAGVPAPRPVALPRVDVGALTVDEGDSGTRSYRVPVSMSGSGTGTVRLFVTAEDGTQTTRLVTVHPGQPAIEFPFEVTGNTRWGTGSFRAIRAKAIQGAVSGGYVGGLTVRDDDPRPTVTITPSVGPVPEGTALTWTATASAIADSPLFWYGWALPPTAGPELSVADVDPVWFREHAQGREPEPGMPLSDTLLLVTLSIEPGDLTATLTVPTIPDNEPEPTEHLHLRLFTTTADGHDHDLQATITDRD